VDDRDAKALLKVMRAQYGFFTQPRMFLYCAMSAVLAAILCMEGYPGFPTLFIALALVFYGLAFFAGIRSGRMMQTSFSHGQEREVEVNGQGVTVSEPGMRVEYAWARFARAYETREHFALISGPGAVLVPKRSFQGNDLERARDEITAHITVRPIR